MYRNFRIVVVTASGRKKYQSILFEYIKKHINIIDEYIIWQNTANAEDIIYFEYLKNAYNFVSIDRRPSVGGIKNIAQFYDKSIDSDTIYIKLDDDIVYLDTNFFKEILDFRIENEKYFLVCSNTINNAICAHIHHRIGALDITCGISSYNCMCNIGWRDTNFVNNYHNTFIDSIKNNTYHKFIFNKWELFNHERFSINAVCWFGKDMKKIYNQIGHDDENDLTSKLPKLIGKINCICGTSLCSHYAFFTQRNFLDSHTNILNKYNEILINNENI